MRNNERWRVLLNVLVLACELTKSKSSAELQKITIQLTRLKAAFVAIVPEVKLLIGDDAAYQWVERNE